MVSDLVCSPVALIALVWLLVMLHDPWPSGCGAGGARTATASQTTGPRSRAPQPLAGLLHTPAGPACEQAAASRPQRPCAPPPRRISTRGRRRQVDTAPPCCPHPPWASRGGGGFGQFRAPGHPRGKRWRHCSCRGGDGACQETHGTPLQGKHVEPNTLGGALAALAEGLGIRAGARLCEADPHPVLSWLVEAAASLEALSRHVRQAVHVDQMHRAALCALLRAVTAGEVTEAAASQRRSRSPHGGGALDPVTNLLLTLASGERPLAMAPRVVHQLVPVLAPACLPLCRTDGAKDSFTASVPHCGRGGQSARPRAHGAAPTPRWRPRPGLLAAPVLTTVRRRRWVRLRHRVVCGTRAAGKAVLAKRGGQSNTAWVERLPLAGRHPVAAMGRRVNTVWQHEAGLGQPLAVFPTSPNFCLPHPALRVPLAAAEPTHGTGSARTWRPCTPAMAAGLTDRVGN